MSSQTFFIYRNTSFGYQKKGIPLLFLGEKLRFFRANLAKLFEVGGGGVGGQSLLLEGSVFKENRVAILFTYYYKVFKKIWRAMAPPLLPMLIGNKEGQIRGIWPSIMFDINEVEIKEISNCKMSKKVKKKRENKCFRIIVVK